ncbi:hypothetical protein HCU64_10715 [Methylobacterium sp. C25]|uniref:hypothetical protein n=1 Tax=Methylobacterium sp. C25 TaxID=2721622 RepID=UPI001F2BA2F8|nr:hypothetical protein [Methylobacterium sp. C25]MCE4224223.1 hypothetical protein [Methylobacterium sp. C25]
MLGFFNTRERLRFLLLVGVIAAPILVGTALVVSWMEADGAASGEPNGKGGLHYRIQNSSGAKTLPPPLAPVFTPYPGAALVDVSLDTDAAGAAVSAAIIGTTKDAFSQVATFYAGQLGPSVSVSQSSVIGTKNGYTVVVSNDRKDASGDTRFSYNLSQGSK